MKPFSPSARAALFALAIALFALFTYRAGLSSGFANEDRHFIVKNAVVKDLSNLPLIWKSSDTIGVGGQNPYYRPVTTTSFAIDTAIWGQNGAGFHFTSMLLHAASCVLLFFLGRRLAGEWGGLAAAAAFAAHPANAEAVSYISARGDLLCGVFLLSSVLLFARWVDTGKKAWYALSLAAGALALLSKELAYLLPALIVAVYFLSDRKAGAWKHLLGFAALVAAYLALRSTIVEYNDWGDDPLATRLATSGTLIAAYVKHTVFPFFLRYFYAMPTYESFGEPIALMSWAFVLLASAALVYAAKRMPEAAFGILLYVGALFPVAGFVTLIRPRLMSDRYLYIPLMGAALFAGVVLSRLLASKAPDYAKKATIASVAALALAMSGYAYARSTAWADSCALFKAASEESPEDPSPLFEYGVALLDRDDHDGAEKCFLEASRMGYGKPALFANLGIIALNRHKYEEAESYMMGAIKKSPNDPLFWSNFAVLQERKGDRRRAFLSSMEALKRNPWDATARNIFDRNKGAAMEVSAD